MLIVKIILHNILFFLQYAIHFYYHSCEFILHFEFVNHATDLTLQLPSVFFCVSYFTPTQSELHNIHW
jgi:hypothetical protein